MSRSRSVNRANRYVAKKRRQGLRSSIPNQKLGYLKYMEPKNLSREINDKEVEKIALFELSEIDCPK